MCRIDHPPIRKDQQFMIIVNRVPPRPWPRPPWLQMALAPRLLEALSYLEESDSYSEDETTSDFDLDSQRGVNKALECLSGGVDNAIAVASLNKMALNIGFLERPCNFRNYFRGVTIGGDGGSVAAAISIMEGHISFFWKLVDAGVSLGSLISFYKGETRDTMTLGALALLSLVRQCPGANRAEDREKDHFAEAWAAHHNVTVMRSIYYLLECGVDLSENICPLETPRVEQYSLGASAVVTAAESGHWVTVDRLLEAGVRLEDKSRVVRVIDEWLDFSDAAEDDLRLFEEEQAETGYSSEPIAAWWAFEALHDPPLFLKIALLTEPARRQITRGLLKACRTSKEMPPACLKVLVKFAYLGLAQDFFDIVVKLENPRWFDQRWSPGERALRWCLDAIMQESGRAHRLRRLRAIPFLEKHIMQSVALVESFLGWWHFRYVIALIQLPTELSTTLPDSCGAMLEKIDQLHFPLVRVVPAQGHDRNGSPEQTSAPLATPIERCTQCDVANATWFGWECQKSTGGCGRICPKAMVVDVGCNNVSSALRRLSWGLTPSDVGYW